MESSRYQQMRNWSLRLIAGDKFDDLDEGEETLLGYRSAAEGSEPGLDSYADFGAQLEGLVETVKSWREAGVQPAEIDVCPRTKATAEQARGALAGAGLPASKSASGDEAIHVGTMHGRKGLELRCVAMIDLSASSVPPAAAIISAEEGPLGHAQDLQRERCLLYVVATRAREMLYVSHTGDLTPLMDKFDSPSIPTEGTST
jgi:superfamily I DNA/RNA helicase